MYLQFLTIYHLSSFSSCIVVTMEIIIYISIIRSRAKGAQFVLPSPNHQLLKNKTIVITGGNCGIGEATVRLMYEAGAVVIMGCRDVKKGEIVCESIVRGCGGRSGGLGGTVTCLPLDLTSLPSIATFCNRLSHHLSSSYIDILICNAGIMLTPFSLTHYSMESQFGVNYFSHAALIYRLLPLLKSNPLNNSRIISVSSTASYMLPLKTSFEMDVAQSGDHTSYNPLQAYAVSKQAQIIFMRELQQRFLRSVASTDKHPSSTDKHPSSTNTITCFSLHPGFVGSDLFRYLPIPTFIISLACRLLSKTPEEGCQTTIHVSTLNPILAVPGGFYADCKYIEDSRLHPKSCCVSDGEWLWRYTRDMLMVVDPTIESFLREVDG